MQKDVEAILGEARIITAETTALTQSRVEAIQALEQDLFKPPDWWEERAWGIRYITPIALKYDVNTLVRIMLEAINKRKMALLTSDVYMERRLERQRDMLGIPPSNPPRRNRVFRLLQKWF